MLAANQAIFTIVSANYIAFAATLMQSVRTHHPDIARFVVLVDSPQDFPGLDLAAELLDVRSCGIDAFDNMALWYDVMELNTAVKPSVFLHLFARGFEHVVYLDPDILVTAPLTEIRTGLHDHDCVLTPHHLRPLQDGRHPDDHAIMKSGIYNLGFLGLRASEDAGALVRWWADRVRTHCRVDIAGNIFTDQRWMDLAPAFVERLLILRHPGCNLAYWNLSQRNVAGDRRSGWAVDGRPLVFVHFSGVSLDRPEIFSKHQNRFDRGTLPAAMADLYDLYCATVMDNGWTATSVIPYGLGRLNGGRAVDATMRRCLLRALDAGRLAPSDAITDTFFDERDDLLTVEPPISRVMHQLWLDRDDLRAHFPLSTPDSAGAYREWFTGGGAASAGIDARSIEAARSLGTAATPPWRPVSADFWVGRSNDAGRFLAEPVEAVVGGGHHTLPRIVALAWERRADLRQHFPLNTAAQLDAFLVWCLTYGVTEDAITPAALPAELYERFAEPVDFATERTPMTRGLTLTSSYTNGRSAVPGWENFPNSPRSRLSHGLWYCFVAPSLFRWPDIMTAKLRGWFAERSDLSVGGFRFSRGAMTYWWLRPDLVEKYPLLDEASRTEFLLWLLAFGLDELGVSLRDFDPELASQIMRYDDAASGVNWLAALLCRTCRPDLAANFNLATDAGRDGLAHWSRTAMRAEYGSGALGRVLWPDQEPASITAALALTGTWASSTGLGEHLRSTARALLSCGFDDFVEVDIVTGEMRRADGALVPHGTRVSTRCNLVHLNAETAAENWVRLRNIGLVSERAIGWWAWELEMLPSRWLGAFNYYDEVWGISTYVADALRKPALRLVRPMLQAVDIPADLEPASRSELGLDAAATIFLFMFDMQSFIERKNPQAVIAAFRSAFPDGHEMARLVIKIQNGAHDPASLAALRASASDPRIEFRDATLERTEVLRLISCADAFVSLHRAEGFGRGPAEAMALGKPVILTDYSGTRDFADADNALLVPCTLVPIRPDQYVGVEGQSWAEPDIEAAAAHMRWVHQHREQAARLGERAKDSLQALTPEAIGPKLQDALGLGQAGRVVDFPDAQTRRVPSKRRKTAASA